MKKRAEVRPTKKVIPFAKVAMLWANGKTVSEISDQMGWTKPKARFPYSYTYDVLKRLRKGASIGLITIRINKKREMPKRESIHSKGLHCPVCGARQPKTK